MKPPEFKVIESPQADRGIRKKIENIKRQKILGKKVVSLTDFRDLKKSIESRTILVVDDDDVMRSALNRILEVEGYKVIQAEDGLELSKILESARLDMILLDVNLPWVNGYELCRLVKEHHFLKHIPLIFVSGCAGKNDIEQGFSAGCDEYITKPFEVDHITNMISKTLLKSS
jgi:CheY-like chemotaxis protein